MDGRILIKPPLFNYKTSPPLINGNFIIAFSISNSHSHELTHNNCHSNRNRDIFTTRERERRNTREYRVSKLIEVRERRRDCARKGKSSVNAKLDGD